MEQFNKLKKENQLLRSGGRKHGYWIIVDEDKETRK